MNAPVRARLDLRLVQAGGVPVAPELVPCEAIWDESDPLTVRLLFSGDGIEVEWTVARDMLAAGLTRPVGVGDVRVWPGWRGLSKVVNVRLSSPDGCAVLQGPASQVALFLAATEAVVAPGSESVDVDAALARIFEAAA